MCSNIKSEMIKLLKSSTLFPDEEEFIAECIRLNIVNTGNAQERFDRLQQMHLDANPEPAVAPWEVECE